MPGGWAAIGRPEAMNNAIPAGSRNFIMIFCIFDKILYSIYKFLSKNGYFAGRFNSAYLEFINQGVCRRLIGGNLEK